MRFALAVLVGSFACGLCGCAAHRPVAAAATQAPIVVAGSVRDAPPNDYLRVSFLPATVKPTSLSRPGALRAFATATPLYEPPLSVAGLPYYSGLVNNDKLTLVAMRCKPPHPETVDAMLATWPNVFAAIQRDVPVNEAECSAGPSDAAKEVACYAREFDDPPSKTVPSSLAHMFSYAGVLFDGKPSHADLASWLQSNYGIFPAFAGTGYSVRDSYSLDTEPMTGQQILAKSISSEYILKNVSLAEAGCRCVSVAPYDGRAGDPVDPDFIDQAGGAGDCKAVAKLRLAKRP